MKGYNLDTGENLLFYDVEVFKEDSLVVFMDFNKENKRVFHNDFTELKEFIEGKTLVGFNNYFYDDVILHYMLDGKTPYHIKQLNDRIISGERVKIRNYEFDSLDAWQQIDVSMPSLKKIEGNMGKMILESSVSFNIDRKLTDEELKETIDYCTYDVEMTVEVFKKRIDSYFKPKETLINMYGDTKGARWNTTTLSANVLMNKPNPKWAYPRIPEDMANMIDEEILDLWMNKDKGKITIDRYDSSIEFGFGGLHGVHKHISKAENVKLLDVSSMYPHIILNINGLGSATETYKQLLDERVEIKHKDRVRSDALKLILNSVYGNLKNKYSILNNPKCAVTVCAYGQIALYELCKRLSPYADLVNINTDGVAFIPHSDDYLRVWKDWEKEFNLTLEEDQFDIFIQRDVNNYVAKKGDIVVCKGGDVNRYSEDAIFRNNNARILDIALVDKLLYNKDILDTLMENLDKPYLYQYILQAGSTYKGTFDNNGVQHEKVNRVFASKEKGFFLYKKRQDDGMVRFPDAPNDMLLWNDDCDKLEDFHKKIDLNHYYQIVNKRLEKWI